MAEAPHAERRFPLRWFVWVAVSAVVLVVFPPFHVRPLGHASAVVTAAPDAVDVPQVAEQFWAQLMKPAVEPVDIRTLMTALGQDPANAMEKYGHRAGIGGSAFFFVSGDASIEAVNGAGVWLRVDAPNPMPAVLITGPIFGSALRDATGLLHIDEFNAPDFNALGVELNRLAETRVQPAVRAEVRVGSQVSFLAAGEFDDATSERPFLKLVPIRVTPKP